MNKVENKYEVYCRISEKKYFEYLGEFYIYEFFFIRIGGKC